MTRWRRDSRWVRFGLGFPALLLTWALLNRLSSVFEFFPGVSFFYPAAAATVVGAAALGPWGALAVWLGNFLFPWGAAVGPVRTAVFGLPEVAFFVLCAAACARAERKDSGKLPHVLVWGIALGAFASATLGALLLALLPPPRVVPTPPNALLGFLAWGFSDLAAASTLGLAGVVLVRPKALLQVEEQTVFRNWWRRRGLQRELLRSLAVAGVILLVVTATGARPHWLALFFLPSLAVAAFEGGTGAAVVVNGLVSGLYLALVVSVNARQVQAVTVELVSAYGQVFLFSVMAWLLGGQAAANRTLLRRVEEQSQKLEGALDEIAKLMAQALEAKEPGSRGHAERVASLAQYVGKAMGMGEDELKLLRRAALLHDVGKLGVSEMILNQPVPLELPEKRRLQQDLRASLKQLSGFPLLRDVAEIVTTVGERFDGQETGAGSGLMGAQLPPAARIIAAVCAYDSMVHPKPWRQPRSREEAVAELWRCSGGQFDPEVVQKLTEIIREGWDLEAEPSAG